MTTIHLTAEQHQALKTNGQSPVRAVDTLANKSYVLVEEATYQRFASSLTDDDNDVERMYALLAEVSPEDWESPEVYGLAHKP